MSPITEWNNRAIFLRGLVQRNEREASRLLEEAKRIDEAAEACIAEADRLAKRRNESVSDGTAG